MPTVLLPGIGATMRIVSAFSARWMSLDSALICPTFTPGASASSYIGDDRPGVDLDDVALDVEFLQRLLEARRLLADE
jgi:hypothetical protein